MVDVVPPLKGIRVVEFSHSILGPSCGMVLADLGVSIIPEPCMKVANQPPLRRIRLAPEGGPVRELGLIWRKDSTKMRVIEEITAAIERALRIGTFSPEAIAQAV